MIDTAHRWVMAERLSGLVLVGSWARDQATMASDIDLVVLTDRSGPYVAGTDWIERATGHEGRIVRSKMWGPVSERRVELSSGLLVEFGFAPTEWASIDPLDEGTAAVARDGFRIIHDPGGLLALFADALHIPHE